MLIVYYFHQPRHLLHWQAVSTLYLLLLYLVDPLSLEVSTLLYLPSISPHFSKFIFNAFHVAIFFFIQSQLKISTSMIICSFVATVCLEKLTLYILYLAHILYFHLELSLHGFCSNAVSNHKIVISCIQSRSI